MNLDRKKLVNAYRDKVKYLNSIKELLISSKISKAHAEIIKYIELYPDDYFGRFVYGRILIKENKLDEAKDVFIDIYNSNSNNRFSALGRLAEIELIKGNISEAENYLLKEINESDNDTSYSRCMLSRLYRGQCKYEEATKVLDGINSNDIYIEKAKNLISLKKIDEAEECVNLINETNEYVKSEVLCLKAKILSARIKRNDKSKLDDYKKVYDLYKKAKQIHSNSYIDIELSKLDILTGENKKALDRLNKLLDKKQDFNKEVYLLIGECYEKLGNIKLAYSNYNIALDSKLKSTRAKAKLKIGSLNLQEKKYSKARNNLIDSYIMDKNNDKVATSKIIASYIREKKYKEAYDFINKNIDLLEDNIQTKNIIIFLKLELNEEVEYKNEYSYSTKQFINYSVEKAIEHVKSHRENNNPFREDINVEEFFYKVIDMLDEKYLLQDEKIDTYIIEMDNVSSNKELNYLKVVCIPNTKNIITMYPYAKVNSLRDKDRVKEEKKPKIKKKVSQIDKFNLRYNLN